MPALGQSVLLETILDHLESFWNGSENPHSRCYESYDVDWNDIEIPAWWKQITLTESCWLSRCSGMYDEQFQAPLWF